MKVPPRAWTLAALAGLLWLAIGLFQKTGRGVAFGEALVSELPVTALVFVVALFSVLLTVGPPTEWFS